MGYDSCECLVCWMRYRENENGDPYDVCNHCIRKNIKDDMEDRNLYAITTSTGLCQEECAKCKKESYMCYSIADVFYLCDLCLESMNENEYSKKSCEICGKCKTFVYDISLCDNHYEECLGKRAPEGMETQSD